MRGVDRLARPPLRGLYAITPEDGNTERLVRLVAEAIAGGAVAIQYRAKTLAPDVELAQARALAALCRSRGVPLIVNDSLELALSAQADGLHMGREDGNVRAARAAFPDGILGVSCYADAGLAREARASGADYVAIGSMFASPTKPGAVHAPLELLAEAKKASGLPVVAIGGIAPENAGRVIAAGADMVAVISAVFDAVDVRAAARAIARLFPSEPPSNRGAHDV